MAALSACASSEKDLLLRDLCVENDGDVGIYGVKFFVMGRWITVYVDDHFPCIRGANGKWKPVFASPKGAVLWPMIFEKAFAKMHRSYECTQLGSAADALQFDRRRGRGAIARSPFQGRRMEAAKRFDGKKGRAAGFHCLWYISSRSRGAHCSEPSVVDLRL